MSQHSEGQHSDGQHSEGRRQHGDEMPTGPIGRPAQTPPPGPDSTRHLSVPPQPPLAPAAQAPIAAPPPIAAPAVDRSVRRSNTIRDVAGAVLVILAVLLPWNLYFGLGVPDSNGAIFAALGVVTLLSLAALAVTNLGPFRSNPILASRLRLVLNVPYLLLVIGFISFDVIQTIKSGGTVHVPGGVGPGAWLGSAGSLLIAQPVLTGAYDERPSRWLKSAQVIGYVSMVGALLNAGFNLCWQIRFALRTADGSSFGSQNIVVIVTELVYGLVALAAVIVGSRWILSSTKASQLATTALGTSTLVAGALVWLLPAGRDIDAFHAIAQNTATAGVGYEGYLAWASAAAIFAPRILLGRSGSAPDDERQWRDAGRKGLLLIAIWCLGSMLMRITDLIGATSFNLPYSRYDTMTLAVFDLVTAILAIWVRTRLAKDAVSARMIAALCGLLVTLSIARVIVGVVLAPRFLQPPNGAAWNHPVYGNSLAHQITSTFDVVLCGVALCILIAAVVTGRLNTRRLRREKRRADRAAKRPVPVTRPPQVPDATTRIPAGAPVDAHTTVLPRPGGSPRIFRGDESATRQIRVPMPKIYRPPSN